MDYRDAVTKLLADPCAAMTSAETVAALRSGALAVLITQTAAGAAVEPGSPQALLSPVPGDVDLAVASAALNAALLRGSGEARVNAAQLLEQIALAATDVSDCVPALAAVLTGAGAAVGAAAAGALSAAAFQARPEQWRAILPQIVRGLEEGSREARAGLLTALWRLMERGGEIGPALPTLERALQDGGPWPDHLGELLVRWHLSRGDREGILRTLRHPDRYQAARAAQTIAGNPTAARDLGLVPALAGLRQAAAHAALRSLAEAGASIVAAAPGLIGYLGDRIADPSGFAGIDGEFAMRALSAAARQGADVAAAAPVAAAWLSNEQVPRDALPDTIDRLHAAAVDVLVAAARQGADISPALPTLFRLVGEVNDDFLARVCAALGAFAGDDSGRAALVAAALRDVTVREGSDHGDGLEAVEDLMRRLADVRACRGRGPRDA